MRENSPVATVLCVLYEDPVDGYPPTYARDDVTRDRRSCDLEGMPVGTVGAGRIGSAVQRRLQPFEVGLHYTDRHRLPADRGARCRTTG
jgi:lactate dehydrogenase-like 2-hydroxyacid dehydrogenase